jgi:multidrug efflux pump subunit AcrA (membrane-fusion protein)
MQAPLVAALVAEAEEAEEAEEASESAEAASRRLLWVTPMGLQRQLQRLRGWVPLGSSHPLVFKVSECALAKVLLVPEPMKVFTDERRERLLRGLLREEQQERQARQAQEAQQAQQAQQARKAQEACMPRLSNVLIITLGDSTVAECAAHFARSSPKSATSLACRLEVIPLCYFVLRLPASRRLSAEEALRRVNAPELGPSGGVALELRHLPWLLQNDPVAVTAGYLPGDLVELGARHLIRRVVPCYNV